MIANDIEEAAKQAWIPASASMQPFQSLFHTRRLHLGCVPRGDRHYYDERDRKLPDSQGSDFSSLRLFLRSQNVGR